VSQITWADVVDQAPELADPKVSISAQTTLLAWANTTLNVAIWGGEDSAKLKLARVYLIAHVATLATKGGIQTAGPVVSQSEGGVSVSYANLMTSAGSGKMGGTTYGQLYEFLLSTTMAKLPIIAGMNGPIGGGFGGGGWFF
jgi:hypothetical protein